MQLILVRHPAPDIAPGVCYGRLDVDLSAAGLAALDSMRATLAASGIGLVVTSPARRCLRLARAIAADPIVDERLQELDFGEWEGLTGTSCPAKDSMPGPRTRWVSPRPAVRPVPT